MRGLIALSALALSLAACDRSPTLNSVVVHPADSPPALLRDWHLMAASDSSLVLNEGVVPYEINSPLFSDYAIKLRTVWMPEGTSATYYEDREIEFPVGTIISKTFHYERLAKSEGTLTVAQVERDTRLDERGRLDLTTHELIETRLLVRYDDGWKAFPYVWNAAQDDATLEIAGDYQAIELVDGGVSRTITYIVPDANQCAGCHVTDHTAKAMRPIGPKAWQLNRSTDWWSDASSQLGHWANAGMLEGYDGTAPDGIAWTDAGTWTLEQRARAYLDANCAHCHNPKGAADTSALHLNLDAPLDRHFGICKTPVAVGRGSGDKPFDIYPGRPEESIMLYRMEHNDPAIAMPELGRSTSHTEGVALVRDWIASLNGEC